MKKKITFRILLLLSLCVLYTGWARAQEDSVVSEEIVRVKYFNENNQLQFLKLESLLKTGKKTEPIKNKSFDIFLDSIAAGNLIAQVNTGTTGVAKAFIPPALKSAWDARGSHTILVTKKGDDAETLAELEVFKGKIAIDTSSSEGVKSITVQVSKWENEAWVPAPEVEMKIGVKRMGGGILSAGEEQTYTSDSSGMITVEFSRDSLPGDAKGNMFLIAKIEDNDILGNLLVEKNVNWGIPSKQEDNFFSQRTLWSTQNRTPVWLLLIAYSIIAGVWGTLLYLVYQLIKIRKLGKEAS